mmetsp:Transcript_43/g.120  ORF Transcript_43/g.120 Transcript_43/m.120 type:complete len:204 (-) Transcript_43:4-615(-)
MRRMLQVRHQHEHRVPGPPRRERCEPRRLEAAQIQGRRQRLDCGGISRPHLRYGGCGGHVEDDPRQELRPVCSLATARQEAATRGDAGSGDHLAVGAAPAAPPVAVNAVLERGALRRSAGQRVAQLRKAETMVSRLGPHPRRRVCMPPGGGFAREAGGATLGPGGGRAGQQQQHVDPARQPRQRWRPRSVRSPALVFEQARYR